jgi:flagellar biosynthesis protein FliR
MLVNAFSVSVMITIWVGILLLAIGAYYLWDGFTGKFEDQD